MGSTAWLGVSWVASRATSASRITRAQRSASGIKILTQPVDVLLDREATNFAPSSAVTILELSARLLAPKKFGFDHQRGDLARVFGWGYH